MFWALLLAFSLYSEPVVCGVGLVIMLTGVPVYFLGVHWREKPKCIYSFIGELTGGHPVSMTTGQSVVVHHPSCFLHRKGHLPGTEVVFRGLSPDWPCRGRQPSSVDWPFTQHRHFLWPFLELLWTCEALPSCGPGPSLFLLWDHRSSVRSQTSWDFSWAWMLLFSSFLSSSPDRTTLWETSAVLWHTWLLGPAGLTARCCCCVLVPFHMHSHQVKGSTFHTVQNIWTKFSSTHAHSGSLVSLSSHDCVLLSEADSQLTLTVSLLTTNRGWRVTTGWTWTTSCPSRTSSWVLEFTSVCVCESLPFSTNCCSTVRLY